MQPSRRVPVWAEDLGTALVVGAVWFGVMGLAIGSYWYPRWLGTYQVAGVWIALTLAFRRLAPGWTFWLTVTVYPLMQRDGLHSYFHLLPLMVASFGMARTGRAPRLVVGLAAGASGALLVGGWDLVRSVAGALVGAAPLAPGGWGASPSEYLVAEALALGSVVMGATIHHLAEARDSLHARNTELQALQATLAEQVLLAERTRIARELHDVVAHHMAAIVVRAQAADRVAPNQPEAPLEAVRWVAVEGKKALNAMRSVVHVLRLDPDAVPGRAPTPSSGTAASALRETTRRMAEAGRAVDLTVPDELAVTTEVELAVVRIAQEALTNVLLHSRAPGASVVVADTGTHVAVTVRDPGPASPDDPDSGGNGLAHMHERARSCGGTLYAGPEGSGWVVHALLPREVS